MHKSRGYNDIVLMAVSIVNNFSDHCSNNRRTHTVLKQASVRPLSNGLKRL